MEAANVARSDSESWARSPSGGGSAKAAIKVAGR